MSIHVKTDTGWEEVGVGSAGLPGLGGWATIESVTGNPTRYEYNDGIDWVAFEWTDTSKTHTLTTLNGGLVDLFMISGGSGQYQGTQSGGGGRVVDGLHQVQSGPIEITVGIYGAGGTSSSAIQGRPSLFGTITTGWAGVWGGAGGTDAGNKASGYITTKVDGTEREYGVGESGSVIEERGDGAASGRGSSGCCVVRVPAANDKTGGTGSIPASVRAAVDEAVDQAKETVKETIKRNRRNK